MAYWTILRGWLIVLVLEKTRLAGWEYRSFFMLVLTLGSRGVRQL